MDFITKPFTPEILLAKVRVFLALRRNSMELEREVEFNASILSTAAALIVVMDSERRIIRLNRACERISGWDEGGVRIEEIRSDSEKTLGRIERIDSLIRIYVFSAEPTSSS